MIFFVWLERRKWWKIGGDRCFFPCSIKILFLQIWKENRRKRNNYSELPRACLLFFLFFISFWAWVVVLSLLFFFGCFFFFFVFILSFPGVICGAFFFGCFFFVFFPPVVSCVAYLFIIFFAFSFLGMSCGAIYLFFGFN